jgi:hypothetical protein
MQSNDSTYLQAYYGKHYGRAEFMVEIEEPMVGSTYLQAYCDYGRAGFMVEMEEPMVIVP